jgi:para-aminobenzoate synthetase/4-amino-4-deoxychorismate lyase
VAKEEYRDAIGRVRDLIAAGDTYQVNYTVRVRYRLSGSPPAGGHACADGLAPADSPTPEGGPSPLDSVDPLDALDPLDTLEPLDTLDPLEYFLALLVRQPVPYAAYLDLGDTQVISLSPELFLRRDGDRLESRPMKGTRPRGETHAADVALAHEVVETEKERAENLMIVDMVRNDLGRVCRTGSVHVPTLYALEPYRTVWQMTSTVQGELEPGTSLIDIMRAVFPGASITGAPKHHTMEIIADVETEPRGVYTGTVALFSPGTDFAGNIGIRTIVHRDGRCTLGVGSGIVWDATAPAEYEETLAKAAFALPPASGDWRPRRAGLAGAGTGPPGTASVESDLRLFETILLEEGGCYRFLDDHLARMGASASALGFTFDADAATMALDRVARSTAGPLVIRLDLDRTGIIELSTRPLPNVPDTSVTLLVSPFRMDPDDRLLVHKTTQRGFYDREYRRAVAEGFFDALFINRLDFVTEGAITNLFARFGRTWVTPQLGDGLLPGVWRAHFLAEQKAEERSLTLARLLEADEIVVGNSVRGAIPVGALAADPAAF